MKGLNNSVTACVLPEQALLQRYNPERGPDVHTGYCDSYCVSFPDNVNLPQFIEAFYTSRVFRLERLLLSAVLRKWTGEQYVKSLAAGNTREFLVWHVESRQTDQVLLKDMGGRTRSWLIVDSSGQSVGTMLYFGSAILPAVNRNTGKATMGWSFTLLMGFHRLYSKLLLASARRTLVRVVDGGDGQAAGGMKTRSP